MNCCADGDPLKPQRTLTLDKCAGEQGGRLALDLANWRAGSSGGTDVSVALLVTVRSSPVSRVQVTTYAWNNFAVVVMTSGVHTGMNAASRYSEGR